MEAAASAIQNLTACNWKVHHHDIHPIPYKVYTPPLHWLDTHTHTHTVGSILSQYNPEIQQSPCHWRPADQWKWRSGTGALRNVAIDPQNRASLGMSLTLSNNPCLLGQTRMTQVIGWGCSWCMLCQNMNSSKCAVELPIPASTLTCVSPGMFELLKHQTIQIHTCTSVHVVNCDSKPWHWFPHVILMVVKNLKSLSYCFVKGLFEYTVAELPTWDCWVCLSLHPSPIRRHESEWLVQWRTTLVLQVMASQLALP